MDEFSTHTSSLDIGDGERQVQARPTANAAKPAGELSERRRKIILEDHEDIPPSGQPFGHNGYVYLLKPGVVAEVPQAIVNILNDSVVSVAITDPRTRRVVGYRDRLRFPYRIVD